MLNKESSKPIIYILLAVFIFFAINVTAFISLNKYKADLTDGNIYSLSSGSKNIIKDINEDIKLRLFFSNSASNGIPILKNYASRVRGLLEQYVNNSNGHISLQIIDPKQFTDDEDLAVAYGIKGFDLGDGKGTKIYFGLAASNSIDTNKVIPFLSFDKERFVEYDITRLIYDLSYPKRKKVAILSTIPVVSPGMLGLGLPELGAGSGWVFVEQLREQFDVNVLEASAENIPADTDVLLLVQPRNMNEKTLASVEQYILRGGKAMLFVDPNKEGGGTGNPEDRAFSESFNKLLNSWGVNISSERVVGDRMAARAKKKDETDVTTVDYIAWLGLKENNINKEEVITSQLKTVNLASAGIIENLNKTGMTVTPLFTSSEQSMKIPASQIRFSPNPNELLSNFVPDGVKYTMAARISGPATAVYPNFTDSSDYVSESTGAINVIVVADSDILRDDSWVEERNFQDYKVMIPFAENNSFIVNAVEYFSGSNDLIALRGRGTLSRPFTVVESLKRAAEERYLTKEKELQGKLQATESRLAELKKMAESQAGNSLLYKGQQESEIQMFSSDLVSIRKELRNVQHELIRDVADLGKRIKFINILLMPLMLTSLAIFIFVLQGMNRKK